MTSAPSLARLLADYREGVRHPETVVSAAYAQARSEGAPAWIALVPWPQVRARLDELGAADRDLPLYGVPFAVKDNIDVAGVPTTAGCPAFARTPDESAAVVQRLVAAGAVVIGKTNMDQFATGLVGTRSPYGACSSVLDERYVSGGSSSGSAVVVAAGTVPFALGTDTAGSGRVPAAFNGIVGVKPSLGRLSTRGTVPACRSLDCVSIFARDVRDAELVLSVAAAPDPLDPYSRPDPVATAGASAADPNPTEAAGAVRPTTGRGPRIGVPHADQLRFFGDDAAAAAWTAALDHARELGWTLAPFDLDPFLEAASLLYDGPWLAERFAAVGDFILAHPDEVDPVVADVIRSGETLTAADLFRAQHRLAALRGDAARCLAELDGLLLPTAPTMYTHAEIAQDPVGRNNALGTYTNFVNLLDLCAVAVPAAARSDGLPFGVTLMGPWGADEHLLDLAGRWTDSPVQRLLSGANGPRPDGAVAPPAAIAATPAGAPQVDVAVVGAHLSGEPLNGDLLALGARLRETARTAATYRLYALPDTVPAKPGLVGGAAPLGDGIEVEVWALPVAAFGALVAGVPPPLSIGTIELADGRAVKGFLCEASAVVGALDISAHGGWRAWRATRDGSGVG